MTQEQKDLLLKDLCSRLPYNTAIDCRSEDSRFTCYLTTDILREIQNNRCYWEYKPYLFPLSSMTDEQIYQSPFGYATMDTIRQDDIWSTITIGCKEYDDIIDWLNKNHFDYRGLIEKGLAIDATELNIY